MVLTRIVEPYAPASPPLTSSMKVACIGSCFAHEVGESLARSGKDTVPVFVSERLNTPFALAYTVANSFEKTPYPPGYMLEAVTDQAGAELPNADAYIVTLGLSLCWFDQATGVMVSAPPKTYSEKGVSRAMAQYALRQTSVAENVDQIAAIIETIRRHKPTAPIILTLSPVPLLIVTSGSPVAANNVSKSTLRVALHEIEQRNLPGVYYWPSYEIVEWFGKYVDIVWGRGENDMRHLQPKFIDGITSLFIEVYYPR